ncbi:MAG TPA: N-acetylmuramic acid 6-phosphate etherase [Candidatus Cybelea sp.]|nr:N-acetylmuramic acid 6-phosphate etherase [Candidatus Cybelea sp.]
MSRLPPTEAENPQSAGLDLLATLALVELLIADQRSAVDAVLAQTHPIAQAVDEIARRLGRGGRLHYVGAGSSGRIATLDASEMPPTFGTPPEMVRAHIAGGTPALVQAVEGAEDDATAGSDAMLEFVRPEDAVLGISASGTAAFVVAAIARAKTLGAYTIALTADAESPLARAAALAIVPRTGAEVLAGSTRLKAGTAQKLVLNAISTAVMVRLGKIYDNLMVDVVANNRKLRGRALRLVARLAQVNDERAEALLAAAGGSVKLAVVMQRRDLTAPQARALLEQNDGMLRELL